MSLVVHVGWWELWLGVEPRWPFPVHAGRERQEDECRFGLTLEIYEWKET